MKKAVLYGFFSILSTYAVASEHAEIIRDIRDLLVQQNRQQQVLQHQLGGMHRLLEISALHAAAGARHAVTQCAATSGAESEQSKELYDEGLERLQGYFYEHDAAEGVHAPTVTRGSPRGSGADVPTDAQQIIALLTETNQRLQTLTKLSAISARPHYIAEQKRAEEKKKAKKLKVPGASALGRAFKRRVRSKEVATA